MLARLAPEALARVPEPLRRRVLEVEADEAEVRGSAGGERP